MSACWQFHSAVYRISNKRTGFWLSLSVTVFASTPCLRRAATRSRHGPGNVRFISIR